jgi:hypothetical protein
MARSSIFGLIAGATVAGCVLPVLFAAGPAFGQATPTATPTPAPPKCDAVTSIPKKSGPPLTPLITVCLAFRAKPDLGFAAHGGAGGNTMDLVPGLAIDRREGDDAKNGLVLAFTMATPKAPAHRLQNGVPLAVGEHRIVVEIRREPDDAASKRLVELTRLRVAVNTAGACVEWSKLLSDDLFGACGVRAKAPAPFGGEVIVPWSALNELFARPAPRLLSPAVYDLTNDPQHELAGVRGPEHFRFCFEEGDEPAAAAAHTMLSPAQCTSPIPVVYREPVKANIAYQAGEESGKGTTQSSSGSAQPSSARRVLAAAPKTSPSPAAASAPAMIGTIAQPLTAFLQLSAQASYRSAILPALNKQTNTTIESVVGQQIAQQIGSTVPGGIGTSTSSTAFTKLDTDTIARLMPSAFRGFSNPSTTITNQPQAFDSTDALDLVPFNPTTVNAVTVGAKLANVDPVDGLAPRLGIGGIAWFHDATRGASASIVHLDQDVAPGLSFGISQVVANTVTPPTNRYVAYPNPADPAVPATSPRPNPILHSANTVAGVLVKFGGSDSEEAKPMQAFLRFATNGLGRDWMAAVSAADLGDGRPVRDDGSSLNVSLLGGYRAIGYAYAPLLTAYNPLAGNQIYFGRLNAALTTPSSGKADGIADRAKKQTYSLSVAGIYAADGGVRAYGSLGVAPSIPLAQKNPAAAVSFSLTGSYLHSFMSSTVYARQGGSIVVPRGPLNLLNNDASSLSFQAETPDSFFASSKSTITATAGLAAIHYPGCTTTTLVCSSTFSRKLTWSLNAGSRNTVLYADSQPGTTRTNPTSISPSIPSSAVLTTALIANHYCGRGATTWGFEPSLTYKNNIAQDGSAFQPGTLLQAALDIGPAKGIKALGGTVLSVSYQNAVNARGTPVALKGNGFGIQLISASQAIWQAHKSKGDPCLAGASTP